MNFVKFLRTNFLTEDLRWLLLLPHFLSSLICYLFMQEKVQTNIKGKILRSGRRKMFFKIAVLKNFAITVKKTPELECFFNKFADLQVQHRLQHRCFLYKFLRTAFFCRTTHCLLDFFEILCDDKIFWMSLATKLIFFIFLVRLISSMVVFTTNFLVSVSFSRITTSAPAIF